MQNNSLRRFGGYLRTRWASPRRIRFWLLVIVVLYTLLGFFVVPWVVHEMAVNTARENLGRELRIESVHANPYTLTLQIDELALEDTDNQLLIGWDRLFVNLSWGSLVNGAWTLQAIHLDNPIIQEERFASGETRFTRLASELSDKKASEKEGSASLPALTLDELRVKGGVLRFADNLQNGTANANNTRQVSLALQDLSLAVENFSLEKGSRSPLHLDGRLEGGGLITFDGELQLLPTPALKGSVEIDGLALAQGEPYLRQFVNVHIDSGTLSLSGDILTQARQPFAFEGSAGVKSLNITDASNDEPLIGWKSLQAEKLHLRLAEKQLETGAIIIDSLSGRVVVHKDRTTNFSQLMVNRPAENDSDNSNKDTADKKPAPFEITLEGIELIDGALRFADHSLPLPFSKSIHRLSGQISTLSSTSAQSAEVKLEGQVGEYGLAQVEGALHAWHPTRKTNLRLRFRNLQIPEYSPYTVRFAGRKIAEGTMDLDLDYTVKSKQLDGQNNLVLHDLKLGEKMAASNAMDLPLDLAIALLENNAGVIDLDLPVSGSVGDPEFDIAQVVRQALGDAIKSVVQAPFQFLASLVGAESEELGQVEFPRGRSDLLPPERARIAKLREALNQRPALAIELSGPFSSTYDGPAVQRKKAIEALRQRLAEMDRGVAEPSLTAEDNQRAVETMFSAAYPEVDLESVRERFTKTQSDSSDTTGFDGLAYRNHLAEKVIAAQSATDVELKAIANARASAVREALVNPEEESGVDAQRVRLLEPKEVDSVEGERIALEVGISAE
ncbi:DUF748 domain-containing protein [Marinimicrobium locisalis]|uniref:DUF748 domain-containing protein n=1 Tax=Marinimicrobium locisalis TaxID=546022 RepID=UPI003221E238